MSAKDGTHRRGFASMDPARRLEVARAGGHGVPADKRSFFTDRELAREAGRKGGMARGRGAGKKSHP